MNTEIENLRALLAEPVTSCSSCDNGECENCFARRVLRERDEARAEVERLKAELDEKSGYLADVEKLIPYKDYIADKTCAENMEVVLRGAYQRGAEAMREAAVRVARSCSKGIGASDLIEELPLPEDQL